MARHAGPSSRFRFLGAAAAACLAAAIALLVLPWATGTAVAQTTSAALTMTGVHTAAAPSGTDTVDLTQGDSVVFSVGPPPQRALLGYYIVLDASPFGGSSSVKLSGTKTYTVDFPSSGSYAFSWTAYSTLGKVTPRPGEYTSATIVVAATPTQPPSTDGGGGGGGSTPPDTGAGSPSASSTKTVTAPPGSPATSVVPGTPISTVTSGGHVIVLVRNSQGRIIPVSVPSFGAPRDNASGTAAGSVGFGGFAGPSSGAGGGGDGGALANAAGNQQYVADPHAATPPRALAVLSIASLAGVAGSYAWLYLGRRAARAVSR